MIRTLPLAAMTVGALLTASMPAMADEERAGKTPNFTAGAGIRAFTRLARSDQSFANGMMFSLGPVGWWGPGIRIGLSVDLVYGGSCTTCSPFGPWRAAGVGPSVQWDVWQGHAWGVSAGFEYRYFAGGQNEAGVEEHRQFHAPGLIWTLHRNLNLGSRARDIGGRASITLSLCASEWLGPVEASPVVGIGLGYVMGLDIMSNPPAR
jgi:hypothetical protein